MVSSARMYGLLIMDYGAWPTTDFVVWCYRASDCRMDRKSNHGSGGWGTGSALSSSVTGMGLMVRYAVLHCLATRRYMLLAALRAPMQPKRSPYTSSRLARAIVAENCDQNARLPVSRI